MQIRLRRVLGNAKRLSDFADSSAQPIVKTQSRLVDLRERLNALRKGSISLGRFHLAVRTRLRSRQVLQNRIVRVWTSEANPRFQVYCLVEGDSVDPRPKLGLAAKRLDPVMNLEKNFLRHIFCFRNELAAQNRDRQAKHESTMPANQFRECMLVAALRASYELGIALLQR